MQTINVVLIDIDSTLNRFVTHALRFVGCDIPDDDRIYKPEWGWAIYTAYKYFGGKLSEEGFWDALTRECWASCPISEECGPILDRAVRLVGQKNVCLLSAPPRGADQLAGKLEWIQRHMPKWLHRQYLFGPRKHYCARPDHLLIDDADHNVNDFIKAGGRAILVPRPWNSSHELPPLEYVTGRLDAMITAKERTNG
jgi:5'(3')-deoxyribonucleotidase